MMLRMTATLDILDIPQRIVLTNVSWSYYEQTLQEIGNGSIRVIFLDGMMELMSPLPEHTGIAVAIGDLIKAVAEERRIPRKSLGSTTFRRKEKSAGSEADDCFYLHEVESVKGMKRFDPLVHRAPDIWVEVDLFTSSIPREPICARLNVPELWRYSNDRLTVCLLTPGGIYADSETSRALPFLPLTTFARFIPKMIEGDQTQVLLEFRAWLRSLPQ